VPATLQHQSASEKGDEAANRLRSPQPASSGPLRLGLRVVAALAALFVVLVGYSVGEALLRAGNDSLSQRVAEWGRDHHLNWAVTGLEQTQYDLHKPKTGGALVGGIPAASGEKATVPAAPKVPHTPAPAALTSFVSNPAPAEGKWQSVVFDHGLPAVRMTYLRPDEGYTSYLAAIMWLDPKLLTGRLHEGITDPGGSEITPDHITPDLAKTVAAAMPGGFRTNNGPVGNRSGYDDQGKVAEPLRTGAASLVVHACGAVTIGQWGRDASMGPAVRSVRQNLDLLVDSGTVNPHLRQRQHTPLGLWGEQRRVCAAHRHRPAPRPRSGVRQQPRHLRLLPRPAAQGSRCRARDATGHQLRLEHRLLLQPEGGAVHSHVTRADQSKGPDHYFAAKAATSSPSTFAEDRRRSATGHERLDAQSSRPIEIEECSPTRAPSRSRCAIPAAVPQQLSTLPDADRAVRPGRLWRERGCGGAGRVVEADDASEMVSTQPEQVAA